MNESEKLFAKNQTLSEISLYWALTFSRTGSICALLFKYTFKDKTNFLWFLPILFRWPVSDLTLGIVKSPTHPRIIRVMALNQLPM